MALFLLIVALVASLLISVSKRRGKIFTFALSFFAIQLLISIYSFFSLSELENQIFFTYYLSDRLALVMFFITSIVALLSVVSSYFYILSDSSSKQRLYYISLLMLDIMLLAVIFSNNIIVNWIFLEATTLAVAFISYHTRNSKAIEATWKYIFISSIGIALAYLGILLLGHEATLYKAGLSYSELTSIAHRISPVIFKISFLLIFIGYSSKLEVVPLYTPSIDINHASPTPSSGFISSALVGAAFVSIFRLYQVLIPNAEVICWAKNVLIIVGILSIVLTAVYAGRTDNYKRLLSYSTVENCAIAMLGLGIGGIGVFAAILHMFAHMIIKCIAFIQMSVVGRVYGSYKVGNQSDYFKADPTGAVVLIFALISLMAFPPSILFRTEISIFSLFASGKLWWVLIIIMIMLLAIIYWIFEKSLPILYKHSTSRISQCNIEEIRPVFSSVMLFILIVMFFVGWTYPDAIISFLMRITANV